MFDLKGVEQLLYPGNVWSREQTGMWDLPVLAAGNGREH
jgi:hypothetical protein